MLNLEPLHGLAERLRAMARFERERSRQLPTSDPLHHWTEGRAEIAEEAARLVADALVRVEASEERLIAEDVEEDADVPF